VLTPRDIARGRRGAGSGSGDNDEDGKGGEEGGSELYDDVCLSEGRCLDSRWW
jgi:hypothetical protein